MRSLARWFNEEVQIFLMGDVPSCAKANPSHKVPQGYFNVELIRQGSATRRDVEAGVCDLHGCMRQRFSTG
jgi:hypothetical protein